MRMFLTRHLRLLIGLLIVGLVLSEWLFLVRFSGNGDAMTQAYSFPEDFGDPAARRFAEAVASGQVSAALAAARDAPGGVNALGNNGTTALLMAVERRDKRMVEALLAAGADPNGAPRYAPLYMAVQVTEPSIVRMLLAAGADPNGELNEETPLYEAALMGDIESARLLLKAGADINKTDSVGGTAMATAAATNHWRMVLFLLDQGASLWLSDTGGGDLAGYAYDSRLLPNNPDGLALPQVIERIKGAGYPWPPPPAAEIRSLKQAGKWPPPGKR